MQDLPAPGNRDPGVLFHQGLEWGVLENLAEVIAIHHGRRVEQQPLDWPSQRRLTTRPELIGPFGRGQGTWDHGFTERATECPSV